MASNLFFKHSHFVASQVKESLDESTGATMYVILGMKGITLGSNTIVQTVDFEQRSWANVEFAKRVTANDVEFVSSRVNWTTGEIYNKWSTKMDSSNSNCFVITATNQVYACVNNNSGGVTGTVANSTPSSTATTPETMSEDSYEWKYLYSVDSANVVKFMDLDGTWMPVLVNSTIQDAAGVGNLGYSPPRDMKVYGLMVNMRIFGDEEGKAFVSDKYSMRGILVNPYDTTTNSVAQALTYEQGNANATALLTSNTGDLVYVEYTDVNNTRSDTQIEDLKIVIQY